MLKGHSIFISIYKKILASCHTKVAPYILAILSFTESCCFIIPPEVLMLPMCYAVRKKSFIYATITTIASVFGAIAGYYIGAYFWNVFEPIAFNYIPGFEKYFDVVGKMYQDNVYSSLFIAAFTPIPFKVFTVAAGVYADKISLISLVVMSIFGRGIRYGLLAGIVYFVGEKAKDLIEKHFTKFTVLTGLVVVITIVIIKVL